MAVPRSINTICVGTDGGRRNKLAANTLPQNPAPTMTMV